MNLRDLPDMSEALQQVLEGKKKKLDDVDPKELKGSHSDREDGDIDNDGDEDETDEYLHNRRKTISKAIKKEEVDLDEMCGPKHGKGKKKEYKEEFDIVGWAEEVISDLSEEEDLDSISDEELVSLFEEAILELSESADDAFEMSEIFEAMESEMEYIIEEIDTDTKREIGGIKRKVAHSKSMDRMVSRSSQLAKLRAKKANNTERDIGSEAKPNKPADEKTATRGERLKAAAKEAGSRVKSGLKTGASVARKVAVKTAGAAGEVAGAMRGGYEKGRAAETGGSRPSPSRPASRPRSTSRGGSSSRGETRSAAKGALKSIGRLLKTGVKKAVGKTARVVSRGSNALARRLGEDYEKIDHLVESGLFEMHEIESIILDEGLKGAAKGAALGAAIGTVVPVVGTGVGAAVGAAQGLMRDDRKDKYVKNAKKRAKAEYKNKFEEVEYVDEATAMAKRGYDETKLRKRAGGGEAADRASALENKPTFGDAKKAKQRQDYARKQRGDFRKTASSNPGLHVGQHKSDDPKVKAKQAARGAQRGALTPNEKKQLNMGDETFNQGNIIDEGVMQKAKEVAKKVAGKAKEAYKKERKFGKASPEAIDRLQRMTVHKQDKYGPSTLKQRLKTGADHNIDNERKAKEGK